MVGSRGVTDTVSDVTYTSGITVDVAGSVGPFVPVVSSSPAVVSLICWTLVISEASAVAAVLVMSKGDLDVTLIVVSGSLPVFEVVPTVVCLLVSNIMSDVE